MFFVDIDVDTGKTNSRKADRNEDKSIYKYGLMYVQHHESLNKFVASHLGRGNLVAFPEKEFQMLILLNREDKKKKNF